ncbi:UNVERIFIED_ORG: cytochrome c-type biogenesis protein [Anoxybacillus amylolyticus]|nr:putative cytochrome c biogenesis protein [Geobacillus sp. GHH01]
MLYMFAYVLGFAAPFFIMSFFIGKLNWIKKYNTVIVRVGEILMVIMGIMLFLDWMTKIIISFYRFVWRIHRFLISKISY